MWVGAEGLRRPGFEAGSSFVLLHNTVVLQHVVEWL